MWLQMVFLSAARPSDLDTLGAAAAAAVVVVIVVIVGGGSIFGYE